MQKMLHLVVSNANEFKRAMVVFIIKVIRYQGFQYAGRRVLGSGILFTSYRVRLVEKLFPNLYFDDSNLHLNPDAHLECKIFRI
jgi:hypothetical protein